MLYRITGTRNIYTLGSLLSLSSSRSLESKSRNAVGLRLRLKLIVSPTATRQKNI